MFWKKAPASPPRQSSEPAAGGEDAALDAIAAILKAFGEHAFDTDNVTAQETRAECDGWARKITVGGGKSGEEEGKPFRRDFIGVRRYFTAQRSHERDFVGRSLGNLREAVHAFARCLTTTVGEDRAADGRVGTQLGKLVGAFQTNDSQAIRSEAEGIVLVVQEEMAKRSERERKVLGELSKKLADLREELQEVREKAALDPLTQLFNRAALDAHLDRVADLAFLLSSNPCILMIDIDHFKTYNDTHGHVAGDEALRSVAAILSANVRPDDVVYRYGGEEFSVLLSEATPAEAALVAERIRAAVEAAEIPGGDTQPGGRLTVSVGLALTDRTDPGRIKERADGALYDAKHLGRNRVEIADN